MCMPSSNVCPRFNSLQAVTIGQAKKPDDGKRSHQISSIGWDADDLSFKLLSKNCSRPKEIRPIYDQIPDLLVPVPEQHYSSRMQTLCEVSTCQMICDRVWIIQDCGEANSSRTGGVL